MSSYIGKLLFTCTEYYQDAQSAGASFNRNVQILRMGPNSISPQEREKAAQEVQKTIFYASSALLSIAALSYIAIKVSAAASAIATLVTVCYSSRANKTIQDLLAELTQLRQGKTAAQATINALQKRLDELTEQVKDENTTNMSLQKKVEELEDTNKKIPQLQDVQLEREERIKQQAEEIERQKEEILHLKEQIQLRDKTIAKMTAEMESLNARIKELETQLNLLQKQLKIQESSLHAALRMHSIAQQTLPSPHVSAQQIQHNLQKGRVHSSTPTPEGPSKEYAAIEKLIGNNHELQKIIQQFQMIKKDYEKKMQELYSKVKSLKENVANLTIKLSTYESRKSHV